MTSRRSRQTQDVSRTNDEGTGIGVSRSEFLLQRYKQLRATDSSNLNATESYEHQFHYLLEAAVPSFSTWCAIGMSEPNGSYRRFDSTLVLASGREDDASDKSPTIDERVPDLEVLMRHALENQSIDTWPNSDAAELPYCIVVGFAVNHAPFAALAFVANANVPGFSPTDVAAVKEVSSLVSDAIERSMLQQDTREAIRRTQRIASQLHQLIATSIAVAGLQSEHDVLRRFAQSARSVFDADRAFVSLERGPLAPLFGVAERNTTARYANPADDTAYDDIPKSHVSDFALWSDQRWCVAPLLVTRGTSRGVIAIERVDDSGFSDEEREVTTLLAQMTSTALGALELSRTIQRSEARWRVLVETAPVGIVEVDLDGGIRWWNRAAAKIFAWSDFSEHLDDVAPLLPSTVKDQFSALWAEALRGTLEGSRDFHDVEINGRQRHLTASAAPLPSVGTETRSLLTLIDDVTNQRELKQELRHAHQMELRGQVASSVAHDFNNLLTLISGYAEILSQDLASDARELDMVRNIQTTASRASQLTGQLQAIGRTQSTESVVLNPVDLIRSNAEVLERIIGADIELNLTLDSKVSNVKVDADQFEQMVLNLTINARDAMPEGGRLTIGARNVVLNAQDSSLVDLPGGEYVIVSVADTGVGMDEETQRRCFEPLFTTKGPFNGTGMGLAAARRLVEESGGAIHFTSALLEGTTFEVYFPAILQGVTSSTNLPEVERPRGSATVLLAEDDENLRQLMARVLRRNGYQVTEASSAEEALDLARTRDTHIDVLVSDVVMNELSGPELARQLQNDDPSLRVLLISGTADATVLDELNEGTGLFLAKPFKPSELIDEVHDLLEHRGSETSNRTQDGI
jgi:PAS domain S-box-containing protein